MVKGPLPTTPQDPCPPSPAVTICSVKTGMSGGVPCKERKGQALSPDPPGDWDGGLAATGGVSPSQSGCR